MYLRHTASTTGRINLVHRLSVNLQEQPVADMVSVREYVKRVSFLDRRAADTSADISDEPQNAKKKTPFLYFYLRFSFRSTDDAVAMRACHVCCHGDGERNERIHFRTK